MAAPFHTTIFFVAILACFASVAFGIAGKATFYKTSACYGYQAQGTTMIAAVSPDIYRNGAACGRMYRVSCTGANCRGGSVTVKVVDLWPTCGTNQFDLSSQAFAKIANPDAGVINIDYVR
ncbi:EG45-like domain containing protein [Amaranthus tricolor]|uniref:EG45-like domain containing protein n=1 Tax=Amaranthus tricolor TaxID=29722 RepID=UPI00258CE449|nr:EG45-like domain containing protein [Amaranthus tricolor]